MHTNTIQSSLLSVTPQCNHKPINSNLFADLLVRLFLSSFCFYAFSGIVHAGTLENRHYYEKHPHLRVAGQAIVQLKGFQTKDLEDPNQHQKLTKILDNVARRHQLTIKITKKGAFGLLLISFKQEGHFLDEKQTLSVVQELNKDRALNFASENGWKMPAALPNDPNVLSQWSLAAMGMSSVWESTKGFSSQRIAVIDQGIIRNHEDLQSKDLDGYDFLSNDFGNGEFVDVGSDGDGWDDDYQDSEVGVPAICSRIGKNNVLASYHGTHVSGLAAAASDNGIGIAGIAQKAQIITGRALTSCGGDDFGILQATAWSAGNHIPGVPDLAANKVAKVINLSLGFSGGGYCTQAWRTVLDPLVAQNTFFVVAAGNASTFGQLAPVGPPANCLGVIAVAASEPYGQNELQRTNYSSFGPEIDIVAPGGNTPNYNILSTLGPSNSSYGFYNGTSMAAPLVAGAISLLLSIEPTLTVAQVKSLFHRVPLTCENCDNISVLNLASIVTDLEANGVPEDFIDLFPDPSLRPLDADDEYEPNNTWFEKHEIFCGDELSAYASRREYDIFLLKTEVGQEITIETSQDTETTIQIALLSGPENNDVIMASSSLGQETNTMHYISEVRELGISIFAEFEQFGNHASEGPYTLKVNCEPVVTSGDDAGQAMDSGSSVELDSGKNPILADSGDSSAEEKEWFNCQSSQPSSNFIFLIICIAIIRMPKLLI